MKENLQKMVEAGEHSQQNKWEKKKNNLAAAKGLLCLAVAASVIVLVTE